MEFSQESYDKNDKAGRSIFERALIKNGFVILSNEEDLGVDIIATKKGRIYKFEVQLSRYAFSYPSIWVYYRKKKIKNFYYIIISTVTNTFLIQEGVKLFKNKWLKEVQLDNDHRKGVDVVYNVPINEFKEVEL